MGWQGLKLEIATGPSFLVMADWLSYYWSRVLGLVYVHVCSVGDGTRGTMILPVSYTRAQSWYF